jgi:hypothetical protein
MFASSEIFQLIAAIDTNMQVHEIHNALSIGIQPSMVSTDLNCTKSDYLGAVAAQAARSINNCPPPSRIFHGRQGVLEKMDQFFKADLDRQKIYLLHGLGGSGKTQIALKFVHESSSQ